MPTSVSQRRTPQPVRFRRRLAAAALIWWGAALIAFYIDPGLGGVSGWLLLLCPPAAHTFVALFASLYAAGSVPGLILVSGSGALPLVLSFLLLIARRPVFVWSYATATVFSLGGFYLLLSS